MSKAFTKESDGDRDEELEGEVDQPAGFKNYITPAGHKRLQEELARLWKVERPAMVSTVAWAAGNGDRSENGDYIYGKKRLREIDRRLRYLSKSLDSAVVVDNAGKARDRVFFGATVTYQRESGEEREVTVTDRVLKRYAVAHEEYLKEIEVFCTNKQVPYFRADIGVPFDDLILRIFRRGGFVR